MVPGLTEAFHPQRQRGMPGDRAQPGQRRGVAVDHRHDAAVAGQAAQHPLGHRGRRLSLFPRPLRAQPAGVQPVGRGDGQHADVAAILGQHPGGADHLGRDDALVGR